MRKILLLRGGALGDFIVTLPALATLRRAWPSAHIALAGNATAASLALEAKLIDVVHSQHEARWSALFAPAPLPVDFSTWLASFDLVVSFWPDESGEIARHFPLRADQKFLSAPAHPARPPAAAHYCAPLQSLGLPASQCFYFLRSPNAGAQLIALHPGSGSPKKSWPLDRWTALAESLRRDPGAELLVVTGEVESDAAQSLARFGRPAHALPLAELVAKFAECRLFIGHDSGVSHLAAACGVPCVLLFGPTDPAMWAPPAPHVKVIQRGAALDLISVDEVQREVSAVRAAQK